MNRKRVLFAVASLLLAAQLGAAPALAALIVDGGFRPAANGFKFQNHGNTLAGPVDAEGNPTQVPVTNLTAAEMIRFFGNQVCASGSGQSCVLTPPAKQWMEQQNQSMDGGHCSGYSIMSALVYSGSVSASDFGAAAINDLNLAGNTPLQREIAYWAATQGLLPGGGMDSQNKDYDYVLDTLNAELAKPAAERQLFELGIQKRDQSGGHSILPYAIDSLGNNKFDVLVYDNNYPGREMRINIDRTAKTWKYATSADPSQAASDYDGDAASKTLFIRNVAARLLPQQCPFCTTQAQSIQSPDNPDEVVLGAMALIVGVGAFGRWQGWWAAPDSAVMEHAQAATFIGGRAALVHATNADGQETGRKLNADGSVSTVNDIPGSKILENTVAIGADAPPALNLPDNKPYTVVIDGRVITHTTLYELSTYDANSFMAVEEIALQPGQIDTVTLHMDRSAQVYTMTHLTTADESPVMAIGVVNTGADYEVRAKVNSDASGQNIMMKLDNQAGKVAIRALENKQETFAVQIDRIDDESEITFSHSNIVIPANATLYLDYGMWTARGQAVTASLDLNSDGSIDQTMQLSDSIKLLVPMLIK